MDFLSAPQLEAAFNRLPPVDKVRASYMMVVVPFDKGWLRRQEEDWGRTSYPMTFYKQEGQWLIKTNEVYLPITLILKAMTDLPHPDKVPSDFYKVPLSAKYARPSKSWDSSPTAGRVIEFWKAIVSGPRGGPMLDWTLRQ